MSLLSLLFPKKTQPVKTEILGTDEEGNLIVRASNYYKAARIRDEWNPQGGYKTLTRIGPNLWKAGKQNFDI